MDLDVNDLNSLNTIKESNEILLILNKLKEALNISSHSKSYLLKMDKVVLAKYVIPFLDIKDMMNLRLSSRELNYTINNFYTIVNLIKTYENKRKKVIKQLSNVNGEGNSVDKPVTLKSFNDIDSIEDVQEQIQALKKMKEYLTKKLYQSESFIKVCKTDIEYLKGQLKMQTQLANTLNDTLNTTRKELDQYKEENIILNNKYLESNKKLKDNTHQLQQENDQLKGKVDKLSYEIDSLQHQLYKLNKVKTELSEKNTRKSQVLKNIRNYLINSEFFRVDTLNLKDFDKLYVTEEKKEESFKSLENKEVIFKTDNKNLNEINGENDGKNNSFKTSNYKDIYNKLKD